VTTHTDPNISGNLNTFFSAELFRIPVTSDGAATIVKIETSTPLARPDGLRTAALVLVERAKAVVVPYRPQ
jgi:hypothetical protein